MGESEFHPDLKIARYLPRAAVGPRSLSLVRAATAAAARLGPRTPAHVVPLGQGVSVRVFRPAPGTSRPALLWIHGGGYVMGTASQDDRFCRTVADRLGVVVASVDYRLAPEHPFPTPLEDCYAGLTWLAEQTDVDRDRIAIGGGSAGGGLAVALTLLAVERDDLHPVFQLLSYPMLDDRTDGLGLDPRRMRMWNGPANQFGWASYLGPAARGDVPPLAAPARYQDLGGLPPAWIGVGTNDLFRAEDVAYAERLRADGVDCTLHEVPGAYHGFDAVESKAPVSRAFLESRLQALADSLAVSIGAPRSRGAKGRRGA